MNTPNRRASFSAFARRIIDHSLKGIAMAVAGLTLGSAVAQTDPLERGFANPPREARPMVWWHWVSANVSKEGIRADLEDMKRCGIGGVQMFDVDLYQPHGPVRFNTDTWHEHVQYAIQVCNELGLEYSMMDCAGWSESAGPWIKPEKSMKKVVWTETDVDGGNQFQGKLPQPLTVQGFYQDIAVLAVPNESPDSDAKPEITSDARDVDLKALTDGDDKTIVTFPESVTTANITFAYPQQSVTRSHLTIGLAKASGRLVYQGQIESSEDGKKFRTIRTFNENNSTGITTISIPFDATSAKVFRVVLKGDSGRQPWPLRLAEIALTSEYRIEDLMAKTGMEKPQPAKVEGAGWDKADPLAIQPDKIIDLSKQLSPDGTLSWAVPEGHWTILRFGFTATGSTNHPAIKPEGLGLEVDKFDADAVNFHFDQAMSRLIRDAKPYLGKTFNGILFDSWEAGMQNWTATMPQLFREKRGYDLMQYLPCLAGRVVGSRGQSEAFLFDFRKTIGELYAEKHFRVLRELSKPYGLQIYAETYGGALDEAYAAEEVDVPMCEFWIHMTSKSCKRQTSLAHTTGQRIIAAESFTARPPDGRWQDYPAQLKPIGDAALIEGINRMCFHTYVQQPRLDIAPGFTSSRYGPHFGRLNSWWVYAPAWVEYLARSQYLLQQGQIVKDLLYLRHEGLDPSGLDEYPGTHQSLKPEEPRGYGVDFIATRQFLQSKAEKGVIRVPSGVTYRVLGLPDRWAASLETLKQIDAFVSAGVPVFGSAPECPTGLVDLQKNSDEWKALVAKLWSGKLQQNKALDARALAVAKVAPDFRYKEDAQADVRFIHRADQAIDIYFLTNQSGKPVTIDVDFRIADRAPELWDAVSGKITPATSFEVHDGRIALPLALDQSGSVFVVFRKPLPNRWIAAIRSGDSVVANHLIDGADGSPVAAKAGSYTLRYSDGKEASITLAAPADAVSAAGPWKVEFQKGRGAPDSITLDKFASLSTQQEFGVKHFSGVATYSSSIEVPASGIDASSRAVLELGEVNCIAEVKVNGQSAGIVWKPPFAVDVTKLLKPGTNELTVAVANQWVNRLIGDEHLPADVTYTGDEGKFTAGRMKEFPTWWKDPEYIKTRQRITLPTWRHYTAESPLLPSGLVGPVQVRFMRVVLVLPS